MELLRREALLDAEADTIDNADGHAAVPAVHAHGPVALPALALRAVTPEMVSSFRMPLPVQQSSPIGQLVCEYAAAAHERMQDLGEQSHTKFARDFWSHTSNVWHVSSRASRAESTGLDSATLRRAERRLCAAGELAEREAHYRAQTQLAAASDSPGVELLAFIEGARYDEAAAVLSQEQPSVDYLLAAGIDPNAISEELMNVLDHNIPKEAAPTKLFQTDSQWHALLAVATGEPAQPKKYLLVSSNVVNSPQVLHQNNAEAVARALVLLGTCRMQTVSQYNWKMRLVCSDRASANMAAERLIQLSRPDWHQLFSHARSI